MTATVALLDEQGLGGFSMRKLGQRLGSGTTSVYWYFANKDELIDLARDQVLGEVTVPDFDPADWRTAIGDIVRSLRAALNRHSWVASVTNARPTAGKNSLWLSDRLFAALASAGFALADCMQVSSTLTYFALGASLSDQSWRWTLANSGLSVAELNSAMGQMFEAEPDEHPYLTQWWRAQQPLDVAAMADANFEFGLQRQLDGLESLLAATRAAQESTDRAAEAASGQPSRGQGSSRTGPSGRSSDNGSR